MVYLLYGIKEYGINEQISKIIKNTYNLNISKYDLNSDSLKDVIDDCETISLFDEKKIVIVENVDVFTSTGNKDSDLIEKYLMNINPSTILILVVHSEKIDKRKKITTLIKTKGKVMEFNEDINPETLIKKMLKEYKIEYSDMKLLIDRVGSNPLIIKNEINKLIIYKGDDNNITREDILNVVSKTIDADIFKLIDNIVKKNRDKAIEIYNDILKINEEPLKIVIMLANQFRIMYQSKELFMKGYSEKDIASSLKIHPYRVKLALQNGRNYSSDTLIKYLYSLAQIDIGIKTGNLNKDLALEFFILK